MLMRLKQICNHPSQWLSDGAWAEADSGKLARLREIAEVVAARQEKMLVFTQFREMTAPLAAFLGEVFGRPGLVLHGETAVRQAQGPGADVPGRRDRAVLRAVAEGRRHGAEPDRGLARRAFRSLVEPGGGEPGDRPRLSHRPEAERAGAQVRLPRHGRGEDRRLDRVEAAACPMSLLAGGGEINLTEMKDDELLRLVAPGPERRDEGLSPMSCDYYGGWAPYVPVAERRRKAERAMAEAAQEGPVRSRR